MHAGLGTGTHAGGPSQQRPQAVTDTSFPGESGRAISPRPELWLSADTTAATTSPSISAPLAQPEQTSNARILPEKRATGDLIPLRHHHLCVVLVTAGTTGKVHACLSGNFCAGCNDGASACTGAAARADALPAKRRRVTHQPSSRIRRPAPEQPLQQGARQDATARHSQAHSVQVELKVQEDELGALHASVAKVTESIDEARKQIADLEAVNAEMATWHSNKVAAQAELDGATDAEKAVEATRNELAQRKTRSCEWAELLQKRAELSLRQPSQALLNSVAVKAAAVRRVEEQLMAARNAHEPVCPAQGPNINTMPAAPAAGSSTLELGMQPSGVQSQATCIDPGAMAAAVACLLQAMQTALQGKS